LHRSDSAVEAAREAAMLVTLAVRRTRGNAFVGEEDKESICGPLEEAKQEILLIGERKDHVGLGVVQGGEGASGYRQAGTRSLEVSDEQGWQEKPAREFG
jgi:hypothetical protein